MKLIEHLKERGMNPKLYKFSRSYSAATITFFLYNLSGQLVGYQQYRPKVLDKKINNIKLGRYYTYLPREVDGGFGLEQLNPSKRTIYVTEGVFKAAVLHRLGFNAIAVLTATPKRLKPWFRIMRQTWTLIAIGNNDKAGKKLVNTVGNGFQSPLDLDEMTDAAILELLNG